MDKEHDKLQSEYNDICTRLGNKMMKILHQHMKINKKYEKRCSDMGQSSALQVLLTLSSKILANAHKPDETLTDAFSTLEREMNEQIKSNKGEKNANTH